MTSELTVNDSRCEEFGIPLVDNNASNSLRDLCLIILIFIPFYTFFCVGLFLYYKNSYVWLYKRNTAMLMVFAVGVLVSLYPNVWRHYSGSVNFSCAHLHISEYFDAALLLLPFITRLTSLLLRVNFNKALIEFNYQTLNDGTFYETVSVGADRFVSSTSIIKPGDKNKLNFESILYKICCYKPSVDIPDELRMKYFWSSHKISNRIFSVLMFLFLLLTLIDPIIYTRCTGCTADQAVLLSFPIFVVLFLFGYFVLTSNKEIPDGLGIKHEMKLIGISLILFEIIALPLYLTHLEHEEEGIFAWSLLFYLQGIAVLTISFPYQVYLAKRVSVDNMIDDDISFKDILDQKPGLKAFSLYLATALCVENIFFYKEVISMKEISEEDEEDITDLAHQIYNKYISNEGSMTINLHYVERDRISENIKNNNISSTMFDTAVRQVLSLLEGEIFTRFKKSIYYQAYKGDLIDLQA